MDIKEASKKFLKSKKIPEYRDCVIELYRERRDYAAVKDLRRYLKSNIFDDPQMYTNFLRDSYILTAPDSFDDYMIAMEYDRDKKFYLPRRPMLKGMVDMLQKLADDEADIAAISLPPGVGKSGVGIFFCSFLGGRDPVNGILTSSHKGEFLTGAYNETLREVNGSEYNWKEIFPGNTVAYTNAKEMQIGINKYQRFNTFQFGSILSDLAGLARAKQLLYCDDLIGGTEEAFSIERLNTKWARYTGDLIQRKSGPCKELHIATRWSLHDIIGRLIEKNEGNPRFLVMNVPALDENGHSNFDYQIRDGFSTEKYLEIKNSLDPVMWAALYMGQPVEKEGLVYKREELRRYVSLPEGDPDAILAVVDTAEGGGDDTVMPVFMVYGNDHYLIDAVVTNALPEVSDVLLATTIKRQKVQKCQFESNAAGGRTADKVSDKVKELEHYCNITKRKTTQNKETKILVESDWVKDHVLFPDERLLDKNSMVKKLIDKLCSYTHMGKNPHDDVPDAMAQYAQFYRGLIGSKVEILNRRYFGF